MLLPANRTEPQAPLSVAAEAQLAAGFVLVLLMLLPDTPNAALPDKLVMPVTPTELPVSKSNSAEKPLGSDGIPKLPPSPEKMQNRVCDWSTKVNVQISHLNPAI